MLISFDKSPPRQSASTADEALVVRPKAPRKWSTRTIITVVSVAAAAIAAAGSLWQESVTLAALRLTHEQAQSNKEQQEAQLAFARQQSDQQAAAIRDQLDLMRRSLAAPEKNAEASSLSARLAKDSADFARISFQTSQRAFMILDHSDLASQPQKSQPLKITMSYKNVGLTPALRVNATRLGGSGGSLSRTSSTRARAAGRKSYDRFGSFI
jgi:hypothetical protein